MSLRDRILSDLKDAMRAKDDTRVNYFLNSPDAETIEAERRYVQEKVRGPTCRSSCSRPAPCRPSIPHWFATHTTRMPAPMQAARNMVEYNRRMRAQLTAMRDAANRAGNVA